MAVPTLTDVLQSVIETDQLQVKYLSLLRDALSSGADWQEVAKLLDQAVAAGQESIRRNIATLEVVISPGGRAV